MSDNIYSSNDDDIFEDYVESNSSPNTTQDVTEDSEQDSIENLFSGLDSSFRTLIAKSSFKIGLGESFYNASHTWENIGYTEANTKAILSHLAESTGGKFLYFHRLVNCAEIIARKKTVIKFIDILIDDVQNSQTSAIIKSKTSDKQFDLNLTDNYFKMVFSSFRRIQYYFYQREVAVHKAISDILGLEHDNDLYDFSKPSKVVDTTAQTINDLYIQYFDNDVLQEKVSAYLENPNT